MSTAGDPFAKAAAKSSPHEAWRRMVYMAAYDIAVASGNDASPFGHAATSARKASVEDGSFDDLCKAFGSIMRGMSEDPFGDAMGAAYMELGVGNEAGGQFFTPFHISCLMAKLAVDDGDGVFTVSEPSCGAGGNCIAVAKACHEAGIDWQRRVLFDCQDVDELTALMCYVQLSLIGAAAKVSVGNTLLEERRYTLRTIVLKTEPCWVLGAMRGEW